MTNEQLISVVIITCKRSLTILNRAVESVLRQTYQNIEIIIVDDSPNTYVERDTIKEFFSKNSKIKYVSHKENMGACAARNTGLNEAKGTFIAFLDDDDEWVQEKLELQLRHMDSDTDLVYCAYYTYYESTGKMQVIQPQHECISFDSLILNNYVGSTSFPLIRTSALKRIGGFDIAMQSAQDYDVWLRLIKIGNFKYINEPLVIYHISKLDQISKHPRRKISGLERLIDKNMDYFQNNKYALWNAKIRIIPYYALDRNIADCLLLWSKIVILQPWRVMRNIKALIIVLFKRKR